MLLLLLIVVPMTVLYQQQVTRIQSAQILENKTLHRGTCTPLFSDTQSTDKTIPSCFRTYIVLLLSYIVVTSFKLMCFKGENGSLSD